MIHIKFNKRNISNELTKLIINITLNNFKEIL
jgi:hypothetical protein